MSASPPKDLDTEVGVHSSDDMERDQAESSQQTSGFDFEVKEQDRWLPIANVARIMKTALPDNAKIAKEAKECMQECVSEFISFITSEASEKCQQEKRKTVNGEDILFAMTSLGFENYAEALKIYLAKYRERNSAEGGQRSGSGSHGGPVASASSTMTGSERPNQTLTPPLEGEEIQTGYSDIYGGVTGNGGEAAL